ncbi:actin cytoskeleton-regulatory complex protein PAN1-like [Drosophila pseudoobscura]|uniref:Actin cytoskeleton-regulatory complex protein PAN1-like n=1 Tax=Drosophila pseudoobscura pseudoobscura TaxID=46245 RepID=A0A6I8W1X8_DROPS|nr:actin cytoskeleton-regulatory complex protein PAN1 [Drosophila pseudoobscura]
MAPSSSSPLASPLVSPAPSGHDSVLPTVSSKESAEDSDDEVQCTDGPRAATAEEIAGIRNKKPLTLRDRVEAAKRKFQEATPDEKRRIYRVLGAARAIRRRRDERLEARRRQAERAASTKEPGEESDEAPPPPPFRVVLPPMQRRTDEAETKGVQSQEVFAGVTGRRRSAPEQQQQQHQHQQQGQWQQHQQQGQWQQQQQWRGPEAAVMGPYVSQEVRTAVRQGMVWHHQTLHITWASGPAPCEAQPEAGARVWEETPRGSNSRDPGIKRN